jgi:hypothetical protein
MSFSLFLEKTPGIHLFICFPFFNLLVNFVVFVYLILYLCVFFLCYYYYYYIKSKAKCDIFSTFYFLFFYFLFYMKKKEREVIIFRFFLLFAVNFFSNFSHNYLEEKKYNDKIFLYVTSFHKCTYKSMHLLFIYLYN